MTELWRLLEGSPAFFLLCTTLAGCTPVSAGLDSGEPDAGQLDGALRDAAADAQHDVHNDVVHSDGSWEDRGQTNDVGGPDAAFDSGPPPDGSLDGGLDADEMPTALVQVDLLDRDDLSAGSTHGLGDCLEVSADGEWMVTARTYRNGRFLILRRSGSTWVVSYEVEAAALPGFPPEASWPTCTINDDGSVVAVGNYHNDQGSPQLGATFVIVREGQSWRAAARVTAPDASAIVGVATLSGDGRRLAAASSSGDLFAFTTTNGWATWTRERVASGTRQHKYGFSMTGEELYSGDQGVIYGRSAAGVWSVVSSAPPNAVVSRDLSRLVSCGSASSTDVRFARCLLYVRGRDSYHVQTEVEVDVAGRSIPGNFWVHVESRIRNDGRWTLLAYDHNQRGHAVFFGLGAAYERAGTLGTSPHALGSIAVSETGSVTAYSYANPWVVVTLDAP